MNFLPDTNVLIGYLKGWQPDRSFLEKLIASGSLYLSTVTIAEFLVGAEEEGKKYLDELIGIATIVSVDREIAEAAALYRKQFIRKTKPVYLLDCFIAASCRQFSLTLVTNNSSDYEMKDIKVVKPE